MYKVAVCDDNENAALEITNNLEQFREQEKIRLEISIYASPKQLLYDLEEKKGFDINFLDIEMPELDGLSLVKEIKEKNIDCVIILITTYPYYAITAIELEVFRYIVKEDLTNTFNKHLKAAIKRVNEKDITSYLIQTSRNQLKLSCKEIIYCYKASKMSVIVTSFEEIRERKPLKTLYKELNEISNEFIMIERGYIVNLRYIRGIQGNILRLENGATLPIGNTYSDEVKKQLIIYWRKLL